MAKDKEYKESYKDTVVTKLPHVAFSIYKDPKIQMYYLVKIEFDGPSGTVGSITREPTGPAKFEAIDRFKIAVADESNILGDER
jgi:hypothetical protein